MREYIFIFTLGCLTGISIIHIAWMVWWKRMREVIAELLYALHYKGVEREWAIKIWAEILEKRM